MMCYSNNQNTAAGAVTADLSISFFLKDFDVSFDSICICIQ